MCSEQKRVYYFDWLRIFATFAVIVLHVAAQNWYTVSIYEFEWKVFNLYDSAVRWAVPVFVMISGALFLDKTKTITLKNLYCKSIFRMVVAYLFWACIYAINVVMRTGLSLKTFISYLLTGYGHFWFIPMIIGLYILVPLLRSFANSKKLEEYFLIVGFFFGFACPRVLDWLYTFPATSHWFFLSKLTELLSRIDFQFGAGYVYFFVLGHYLSEIEIKPIIYRCFYMLGIIGIVAIVLLSQWFSERVGAASVKYYDEFTIINHFVSVAVFLFGKCTLSRLKMNSRFQTALSFISKRCFGIYLVHYLVLEKFQQVLGWHSSTWNPLWNVPILSLAIFGVCLLISSIISKIPVLKKYIV